MFVIFCILFTAVAAFPFDGGYGRMIILPPRILNITFLDFTTLLDHGQKFENFYKMRAKGANL
jgi:hypothetical protein